ncbi:MAG: hypothetical protein A2848_00550 [Candidatus Magasanikbacteria bacterium RIFCSPHIGHO2_01_FULL_50_8]|uniref:Uncharacterized protein n=1 Tax=Candidatus Magasanikbacteria bacterium RIFCSPHIGHO2_01_FULL_50_8 TaxID=1798674 RepID=A0A1F6LQP9_9BACT|nr:MAG: hypothetical protein A2848_00550 [Candidatus Magasanikbacteria bacterium RIFCSPHIGHO2_01_FULL_50_8]
MFDDDAQAPIPAAPAQQPAPAASSASSGGDQVPDIFDGSDPAGGEQHLPDASPETTVLGPSALDAGKLQPLANQTPSPLDAGSMSDSSSADLHEPAALKRIMLAAIILVAVALVGAGVWFFVIREKPVAVTPMDAPSASVPAAAEEQEQPGKGSVDVDVTEPTPPTPTPTPTPETTTPPTPTQQPPAPVPAAPDATLDSDKDGLTDVKEAQLGTNANNPDSDGDGLTDGAEINIWGTNALNKDTDGDTFPDGQEVLNGFNPKGQGKLR